MPDIHFSAQRADPVEMHIGRDIERGTICLNLVHMQLNDVITSTSDPLAMFNGDGNRVWRIIMKTKDGVHINLLLDKTGADDLMHTVKQIENWDR